MPTIDVSQVEDLAKTLAAVPLRNQTLVAAAVKHGAQNIKQSVSEDLQSSSNHAIRRIRIRYDMKERGPVVEADIGPEQGGASSLANIAFFGTSRGGGSHRFYEHGEDELEPTARYVREAASKL